MLGFRINPPGPFWLEDFIFFVVDETRRLPERVSKAAGEIRKRAARATESARAAIGPAISSRREVVAAQARQSSPILAREEDRLEEIEAWSLATEPLTAVGTGATAAVALHETAGEQLDALSYVLDRIRDDVRPLMTYAALQGEGVHQLNTQAALDTSIEALLALSRTNAATRPKNRVLTAA
ncbi:hypothetical protein [Hyphomicrobium sp.]|uniref:hypothetical protein n=1 Tax=Hyphomicrobium sp. TaxID=82 RepID=UPI002E306683|nr:hypothetical protein [Hyphomicrobium sp.]HEX2841616.1 hypothetical protein [Hyphomicrobium sp.]